ncbi:MAG: hypothetical protein K8H85_11710 [Cyclobacteriaceae bacterium]|nr:hypothetical protein [Cyclobacteriaceae bacterium]
MDIQAEKLELIEWLANLNDASVIDKIKAIKSRKDLDWWESLSEEQKQDIEAGISDLDSGRKKPFNQVIRKLR